MKKLGIIGCGQIAIHHLESLRCVGFEVDFAASSKGSKTINFFAKKNDIKNYFFDPNELIQKSNLLDGLVLTCPTSEMIYYLKKLKKFYKPILIEKPISYNYKILNPFINKQNVMVGLNRRYYETVIFAKKFIKSNKRILIKVSLPESFKKLNSKNFGYDYNYSENTFENSIHIFDILYFLVGDISWKYKTLKAHNGNVKYFVGIGRSINRDIDIILDNYYQSSSNFSVEILSDSQKLLLKPLEVAYLYDGMKVNFNDKTNSRIYEPKLIKIIEEDNSFKPGFLKQSKKFMQFCKESNSSVPKIADMRKSLKLLDKLIKKNSNY